jgi:hypothetical protein
VTSRQEFQRSWWPTDVHSELEIRTWLNLASEHFCGDTPSLLPTSFHGRACHLSVLLIYVAPLRFRNGAGTFLTHSLSIDEQAPPVYLFSSSSPSQSVSPHSHRPVFSSPLSMVRIIVQAPILPSSHSYQRCTRVPPQ